MSDLLDIILEKLLKLIRGDEKKSKSIQKIKTIVSGCSRFKIGKTGKNPKERFDGDPDYKKRYDYPPETVYESPRKEEVDKLEKELIEYFRNSDEYSSKCDNEQEGGGNMDKESGIYSIYVVLPHDIGKALLRLYASTADSSTLLRCSAQS